MDTLLQLKRENSRKKTFSPALSCTMDPVRLLACARRGSTIPPRFGNCRCSIPSGCRRRSAVTACRLLRSAVAARSRSSIPARLRTGAVPACRGRRPIASRCRGFTITAACGALARRCIRNRIVLLAVDDQEAENAHDDRDKDYQRCFHTILPGCSRWILCFLDLEDDLAAFLFPLH